MSFEQQNVQAERDASRAERRVDLEHAVAAEQHAMQRFLEKKHLGRIAAAFALMTALAAGEARSAHGSEGFFKEPNPSMSASSSESFTVGVSAMPEKNRTAPYAGGVVTTEQLKNPFGEKDTTEQESAPAQGDNKSTRSIGEIR